MNSPTFLIVNSTRNRSELDDMENGCQVGVKGLRLGRIQANWPALNGKPRCAWRDAGSMPTVRLPPGSGHSSTTRHGRRASRRGFTRRTQTASQRNTAP